MTKYDPIKIQIKKRKIIGNPPNPWIRYEIAEKLLLVPDGRIKTEAQLCDYIKKKHGTGRYQLLAWQKGYEGFWLFWLGDIMPNGFMREKDVNRQVQKLKTDWNKAGTYEEKRDIEEEIGMEKEIKKMEKSYKRRGPLLIKTSRPGLLNAYEDY